MIRKYFSILMIVTVTACSGSFNLEPSKKAVQSFHNKFNNENYEAIFSSGTEEFKKSGSKEDFTAYFSGVNKKLGKHVKSNLSNWRFFNGASGKKVSLAYESKFEKGDASEEFTFSEKDGKVLLQHYNIQSKVFIIGN